VLAATAIAAGMAATVLVYRSRARGKQSAYGKGAHQGGRYWERLATDLSPLNVGIPVTEVTLETLDPALDGIVAGTARGRWIVKVAD